MATATIDTDIWLALKKTIDGLSFTPSMTTYDPGAVVEPPVDASGNPLPFALVSDVRTNVQRVSIGRDHHIRSGTLMISVNWPISQAVTHTQLLEMGGKIAAQLRADTCMTYGDARLRMTQDADVMQPYVDGAYWIVTVRAFWLNY